MSREISEPYIKILWGENAGICAICHEELIQKDSKGKSFVIGEMAHIYGNNPTAARYDASISDEFIASYENHLPLCSSCHTIIDKNPSDYPVKKLFEIRDKHLKWVRDTLRASMASISFIELALVVKYLEANPKSSENLHLIPPSEKLKKNNLSKEINTYITIGLIQRNQVEEYLNKNPDVNFAERLKAGIITKYEELKGKGLDSDTIFNEMFDFVSNNSIDFNIRAAALAVLTYFFEICDIFES